MCVKRTSLASSVNSSTRAIYIADCVCEQSLHGRLNMHIHMSIFSRAFMSDISFDESVIVSVCMRCERINARLDKFNQFALHADVEHVCFSKMINGCQSM